MPLDGSEFKFEIDETTKLLIAARELVMRGWCQNVTAYAGAVCAAGGITRSYQWQWGDDPQIVGRAVRHLERAIGTGGSIPAWNDAPGRTKEEVLAAYDVAIAASLSGSA